MDGRIILESSRGANVLELRIPEGLFEDIAYVNVQRGGETWRLHIESPRIALRTPPMINNPSPTTPPDEREGWTCTNTECRAKMDAESETCVWCKTPRSSAV